MNNRVKQFIKRNIQHINNNSWYNLFDVWYSETQDEDLWNDDEQFEELLNVFSTIGISEQSTFDVRKNIVKSKVIEVLEQQSARMMSTSTKVLTWPIMSMHIGSFLGLTLNQMFDIYKTIDILNVVTDTANGQFIIKGSL